MQIPSSTTGNLAALIAKYQAAAKSLSAPTATGAGGHNPAASRTDSASFSPASLRALQQNTAQQMAMLQFTAPQTDSSSSSPTNGLESLLAGFSSAGVSGQLAALLAKHADSAAIGNDGKAPVATAADLVKQAKQNLAQSTAMMFSDSNGQDGNANHANDGLSALLTSYGQSITDAGNKAIKIAQDRITAAAAHKPTTPGPGGTHAP